VIAAVTDNKYLKLTKRDPTSGAESVPSVRIEDFGDVLTGETVIYSLVSDDTSPAPDGSFFLLGEQFKTGYRGVFSKPFLIKFNSDLSFAWYQSDNLFLSGSGRALGLAMDATHVYAAYNFCSLLINRIHGFYKIPLGAGGPSIR